MSSSSGLVAPSLTSQSPLSGALGSRVAAGAIPKEQDATVAGRFALVRGVGLQALMGIVWHRAGRRRKVLVSIDEPATRLTLAQRLVIALADGVLASPDISGSLTQLDIPASRVVTFGERVDFSAFMACPTSRAGRDATRIVYVGELSPRSGVADFLGCAIALAERSPELQIEICWAGRGDLQGVLQAQLLPANLIQAFADPATVGEFAALFAHCGLLVVPSLARVRSPFIAEAMAAGLPVLGSIRSAQVRGLVAQQETGWLYDPLSADQMAAALETALTASPVRLDVMRASARARISALHTERQEAGLDQTAWAALPDLVRAGRPARA